MTDHIRNFCILAHIDHGKSTLADRILDLTGAVSPLKMQTQFLDSMDLERERGVTIKMKAVRLAYTLRNIPYTLNLIDTPGHADFSYEVSRSLNACEGALLLVDAVAGIQAQTLSHYERAKQAGLTIIPVLNKVDLDNARIEAVLDDMVRTFAFRREEIRKVSAKLGWGVEELLSVIIEKVPPPRGNEKAPLRALVIDSKYDEYKGVIAYVRVVDGIIKSQTPNHKPQKYLLVGTGTDFSPVEFGYFLPELAPAAEIRTGEVGYVATGLKEIRNVRVGDTLTEFLADASVNIEPLPGYLEPKNVVFAGLYPVKPDDFGRLRTALEKLSLTDASLTFQPESSGLGRGFLVGFLGTFHAEIVKERLERDFALELLLTRPSVEYEVDLAGGERQRIREAQDFPDQPLSASEPWVAITLYSPAAFQGKLMELTEKKRGVFLGQQYFGERLRLEYEMPLAEMLADYYDQVKSVSSGFASLDWRLLAPRSAALVRLDVLVHNERVPSLSQVVLRSQAHKFGGTLVKKLKDIIPRQQFAVALQAAIGGKIIAREDVPAMRKNVLAKLSGGHRERKDKVLDRQREGKKRLARVGRVDIPEEAFRFILTD
ncbi:MAG: translation elongation factor 4 [Patescibacteria group bacterium]